MIFICTESVFYHLFLGFLLLSSFAWSLTINNYEIRDLESNNSHFQIESKSWNVTSTLGSATSSECSGIWLLGGYQVTGDGTVFTRKFESLPSHNMIYFSIDVWIIDLTEIGSLFAIYFDTHLVETYSSNLYLSLLYPSSYLCGTSRQDFSQISIGGKVPHNSSELTIKIASMYRSSTDKFSIGFRNLNLLFQKASDSASHTCDLDSSFSSSSSCLCPKGYYDPPGGVSCSACNNTCKTCSGQSAMNCTSCKAGYSFDGQTCFKCDVTCNQCKGTARTDCIRCNAGSYLYPNGTCQQSCNAPLITRTEGEYSYCYFPCNTTDYYYENNNTCHPSCPISSSLIEYSKGDFKYCSFICNSSDFLYWNGSCLPTCPVSFQQINGIERYCKFHCATDKFLYWNSSCLPDCPSPLVQTINDTSRICSLPCDSGDFLFPNRSCYSQCNFQVNTSENGISYCNSPCPLNEFYIPSIKSCTSTCPSASVPKDGLLNYCEITLVPYDKEHYIGAVMSDITQSITAAANIMRSDAMSAFKTALVKLVKYVKFINVPIEKDILDILSSNVSSAYSISTAFYYPLPPDLQEKFPKHPIHYTFENQGIHSSYLINNWNTITTCLILFILGLTCLILEKLVKKIRNRICTLIMVRVRTITYWNFLICIFFNNYDDFTLYAILEFQSVRFDSAASVVSFTACIFLSLFALYLLGMVLFISKQAIKFKTQIYGTDINNTEVSFYNRWNHYQVTYAGYQNKSFISQGYLFWFTCRVIITYLIVGILYAFPLVQTVQLTLISILMLGYLVKIRPIKDAFSYYVNIIFEILVFIMNISLLLLAILARADSLNSKLQEVLSYTVLFLNITIDMFGNLVMWLYIILTIRAAYLSSKKFGLSGKTNWLSVLVIAYQNPGMDFHDLSNQEISSPNLPKTDSRQSQPPSTQALFEAKKEINLQSHNLTRLNSLQARTSSITKLKSKHANDSQTRLEISSKNAGYSIGGSIQELKNFSTAAKKTPHSSERSIILGEDTERLTQKKEIYEKQVGGTISSKVSPCCLREKEAHSKKRISESCEQISEGNNSIEGKEDSRVFTGRDITFSINFPQPSLKEIILKETCKSRIFSQGQIDSLTEDFYEPKLNKQQVLARTFTRKTNILNKKSRIIKNFKAPKEGVDLEKNWVDSFLQEISNNESENQAF